MRPKRFRRAEAVAAAALLFPALALIAGFFVMTDIDVMSTIAATILIGTPSSRIFWNTSGPPPMPSVSPDAAEP